MSRRRGRLVVQLAELLDGHRLSEISAVDDGGIRLTLRREQLAQAVTTPAAATRSIDAPIAGVFYGAPPGTGAPFVRVGDVVTPGRCVGLIVVDDLAHEIVANVGGRVVRIMPQDSDQVDAGQALFEVEAAP